jgi:hypothetical protein
MRADPSDRRVNRAKLARVATLLLAIARRAQERIAEIDRQYPEPAVF